MCSSDLCELKHSMSVPQAPMVDEDNFYELRHSTSVPQSAHLTTNWSDQYSRRPSISTESYCSSAIDTEDEEEEEPVVITEFMEDRERTPRPPSRLMDYRQVVRERAPPMVSMARRDSSWERPLQPPRPLSRAGARSRAAEVVQPPRPASRASTSAQYYEISRSPSTVSTSEAAPSSSPLKGKCPHCHIHSWLPHSPQCPRRK